MRALSRVAAGLAVLVGLLAMAAWLVPPMLDWTRYRDEIATLATQQLGRTVRIDGRVSLSLLPEPILAASGVSVEERDRAESGDRSFTRLAIGMRQMRLRVGLAALLSGRIEARELVLRDLDLRLPWPLDTSVAALRAPTWLVGLSARVENGRVGIGDVTFSGVNATLSADGLTGSYQAAGTAVLSGRVWRFTLRATQPGADGSAGIDATLDGQGPVQDVGLVLSGQIDGTGAFGGRVVARGPDLSQLLPAPKVAFRADGRVSIAAGLAAADDLAVEIGGSPARGAVAMRLSPTPRLDVALAAGRLDLDAWLPTLLRGGAPALPLGVDLSAEAADFAGGTVRHLRAAFDMASGTTMVRELQAVLPGDAAIRLTGSFQGSPARTRFEGDGHISAPALRTTLAWAERAGIGPFAGLPADVLRSAELDGHAVLDGGTLTLDGIAGRVDATGIAGTLAARTGARFALAARLDVGELALDPWVRAELRPEAGGSFARPRPPFDIDLRLTARQATARGLTIAPLTLDGAADGGTLTLRRLELVAGDLKLTASGVVAESGRIADARLDVQARQAETLTALLPEPAGAWLRAAPALTRSPVRLQASGAGPADALAVRLVADLGDLHVEAEPTLDLGHARWSGPVTARHPGAPRLAESLGLLGATAWLGDGSLALVATLAGAPGHVAAENFDLTAGALHAKGQVALDQGPGRPVLAGRISADTLPLPLPYARSPTPLSLDWLRGWDATLDLRAAQVTVAATPMVERMSTALALRGGILRLDELRGQVGGGTWTGAATLDASGSVPTVRVDSRLDGALVTGPLLDTSIDLAAGTLAASMSLEAAGHAPAALLATLRGTVALNVTSGTLSGIGLPRLVGLSDDDVASGLSSGITRFDRLALAARLEAGIGAIESASVAFQGGTAELAGTLDLARNLADLRLVARPVRIEGGTDDVPALAERLTGPPDRLRRTPELADLAGWRARHVGAPASSR